MSGIPALSVMQLAERLGGKLLNGEYRFISVENARQFAAAVVFVPGVEGVTISFNLDAGYYKAKAVVGYWT